MYREVFKANNMLVIVIVGLVIIGLTYVFLTSDFPVFFLIIFYAVGFIVVFSSFKTKLVVEGEVLRYEKLFGGEEIDLKNVSQIVSREIESFVDEDGKTVQDGGGAISIEKKGFNITIGDARTVERRVERVIYLLDETGRTHFSFPANLVRYKQRDRFRNAVQAVNPKIEVFN